jgi:hypothetical protein
MSADDEGRPLRRARSHPLDEATPSVFRLVFVDLLNRYRQEQRKRRLRASELARLDDRALFALVQSTRSRAPQGTWSRRSRVKRGR